MTKVVDRFAKEPNRTVFICDFSPPRGGTSQLLKSSQTLDVDFVSVAYNPGKSTRVMSAAAAHWIKVNTGTDVVFTVGTRDMNKVAIQSLLLGAQLLGLENVIVVGGDEFNERDLSMMKEVNDFKPTGLLRSINEMNTGVDFKGLHLRAATDFCAGASIDLGRDWNKELRLTRRKVEGGAHFFISQPTFDSALPRQFLECYAENYGEELLTPIFHGVQIMSSEGIVFGNVPQWVMDDLERGRSGEDIALQVLNDFTQQGVRSFYLVPPILKGGRRDYEAARTALEMFRA